MCPRMHVIDSHTEGEPTRVILDGGPDLGEGPLGERVQRFRAEFDRYRTAVVTEPRGSGIEVGALLLRPRDPSCSAGVIFFNNTGYLGMCGHGTIGVVATLAYLGRIGSGVHRIETPVGAVSAELYEDGRVSVQNVPSYRHARGVAVELDGGDRVTGDVAWGGNWFYLVQGHGQALSLRRAGELTRFTSRIRRALERQNITGARGEPIDHIELFGPPMNPENHSRNFVLCPGGAYDRSPCGTGTSAKLASLFASAAIRKGEVWRQEGILGGVLEGWIHEAGEGGVIPVIRGRAEVNGESTLILNHRDPFCWGLEAR